MKSLTTYFAGRSKKLSIYQRIVSRPDARYWQELKSHYDGNRLYHGASSGEALTMLYCKLTAMSLTDYTSAFTHGRGWHQRLDADGSRIQISGGLSAEAETGLSSTVLRVKFDEALKYAEPPLDGDGNVIPVGHLHFSYLDRGLSEDGCPHPQIDALLLSPDIHRIDRMLMDLFSLEKRFDQPHIGLSILVDLGPLFACAADQAWDWNKDYSGAPRGHKEFWIHEYSLYMPDTLALSRPSPYFNHWVVDAIRTGRDR